MKKLEVFILIILLIIRYLSDFFALSNIDKNFYNLLKIVFLFLSYLLIMVAVWVYQKGLRDANIDKTAFWSLIILCLILGWNYLPFQLGFFIFLAIIRIIFLYRENKFEFQPIIFSFRIFIIALLMFLPVILISIDKISLSSAALVYAFSKSNIFGVVFEEFLFRGILWKSLRDLGLIDYKIIIIQAILFWFAHYHLLLSQSLSFWTTIPFIALALGFIVSKSKSLTVSTTIHFLYNLLIGLTGK